MIRTLVLVVATLAALTLGGCSTFNQQWKSYPRETSAQAMSPLPGRFEGTWKSDGGHTGALRAIITPTEAPSSASGSGIEHYNALFHANWSILSGDFTMELTTERKSGRITFKGSKDLGWMAGGVYTCEGEVVNKDFIARYSSKKDHGVFTMKRAW